ncbi:DNA damage-regulated autophagy modulator protein 2 [Danio rerio]|uniref:DNA damage-regulated autophagy modulator protein 2 n=1 Tax=Danio rerio TaxID=7955 RepID=A0A8M1PRT0_DANRE|nr:DNA damage-regulated autophagy modulator protein 2 [Danio rerio]|eukprot:XP_001332583.1 DNA damage-regulated autophagy modulator protein 2 [Danio rerio]
MWWFQQGLCFLPVALVTWSSATFLISYTTAVVLGHADLLVPYISDTGTEVPERCVFGFMLSISAFLGLGTMYVRYKQVQALISASESGLQLLNYSGLLMGIFSTVGMCVVANFQKSDVMSIHLLGAGLTFGPGTLYILVQTGMSYRMQPRFHGRDILCARVAVGMWSLISIIALFVSSVVMYDDLPGVNVAAKLHWQPAERGFVAHQISATAEWSLAFSFICFFITYIQDFQKITLRVQSVLQSNHLYNYPHYEEREHVQHGERSPLLAGTM